MIDYNNDFPSERKRVNHDGMLDQLMMAGHADGKPDPAGPAQPGGLAWHTLSAGQVLESAGTDRRRGLSTPEAAARTRRYGPNKLAAGKTEPRWQAFARQYRDPMQIVLLAAGVGSLYPLKQIGTGILLILLTLFNAVNGLQQEGKAAGTRSTGRGYSTNGRITRAAGEADIPLDKFLMPMVLASDAVVRDGELIGDPTEGALVVLAAKGGIDAVSTRERYPRIAELPFDATYKLMATFHKMTSASGQEVIRCFVKGAPDQLLARAATIADADAGAAPVDGESRRKYLAENQRLAEQGLRVMATACKDFDPAAFDPHADLLPMVTGLELLALAGIVDPPRPTAKASIASAQQAGIRVRMITGDHAVTAAAVAGQLGIEGTAISGSEFAAMSDKEALDKVEDIGVIARVSPEHKVRLVDLLRRQGQIVAMTGDGVNDAPAVKRADIGIAMGASSTSRRAYRSSRCRRCGSASPP
jgi:magnesium-transporting ATPase (P-type)